MDYIAQAIAIELLLKNLLGSYIVANGRDKAVLDALKRDANCSAYEAGIIITSQTGSRWVSICICKYGVDEFCTLDGKTPSILRVLACTCCLLDTMI